MLASAAAAVVSEFLLDPLYKSQLFYIKIIAVLPLTACGWFQTKAANLYSFPFGKGHSDSLNYLASRQRLACWLVISPASRFKHNWI